MDTDRKLSNILVLGFVAIVLGFIHNVLFFEQSIGINFFLFAACIVIGGWVLNKRFGKTIDNKTSILIVPILFFSLMICVRESELLTLFNILGCLLLFCILARSHAGKDLKDFLPWDYLKVFFLPFKFIMPLVKTAGDFFVELFALRKLTRKHPRAKEVVRGTGMALIALAVFTLLFAGADSTFSSFVSSVFSFKFSVDIEFLGRLLLFLFMSGFFVGAFSYMFNKREEAVGAVKVETRSAGVLEIKILLGSINALFFVFILMQLSHLFGGGSSAFLEGVTYAEYARKGFFELILVAVLSYVIIATAEKQIIKNGDSHTNSFKILSTVLVAQVVVILISAFIRLSLYESAYGFSTIRLYSHAFMIWLGVVLVLLARHILTRGTRAKFAMQVFACVILLLVSMNLVNPDAFIAKRNIERYRDTGTIDTEYLAGLSSDAVPVTVKLLNDPDRTVRVEFARSLYFWRESKTQTNEENWKSVHISRLRARKILLPYEVFIEASHVQRGAGQASPIQDSEFID